MHDMFNDTWYLQACRLSIFISRIYIGDLEMIIKKILFICEIIT